MSTKIETVHVGSNRKTWAILVVSLIILVLLLVAAVGFTLLANNPGDAVVTQNLSEPLNSATTAKIDINRYSGDLSIDQLTGSEPVLASGTLPYLESQELTQAGSTSNGQAVLSLKTSDAGSSGFRLPWAGCSDETEWQIHLNPGVQSDILVHSGGGNLKLNLAGMTITQVSADTGGGNVDLVLPDNIANLNVNAKSGAGNVTVEMGSGITGSSTVNASSGAGNVIVRVPDGTEARIHVTSGMGKATVDPRFSKIDEKTFQSPNYESAANKIEITASSGAGDVMINTK